MQLQPDHTRSIGSRIENTNEPEKNNRFDLQKEDQPLYRVNIIMLNEFSNYY
jgi:hypothetical protein